MATVPGAAYLLELHSHGRQVRWSSDAAETLRGALGPKGSARRDVS
jgi:hypothetical protein